MQASNAATAAPVGRPTLYRGEDTIEQVRECMAQGMSHRKIARTLGVSRNTLYRWADEKPEFRDILDQARDELVSRYETAMLGQAEGTIAGGNSAAGKFMLLNLAGEDYRERQEIVAEVKVETIELDYTGGQDDTDAIEAEFTEVLEADTLEYIP